MMISDRLRNACMRIFHSEDGRLLMDYLVKYARADEADFCDDARKAAYLLGQKSVIFEIRNIMKEKKTDE